MTTMLAFTLLVATAGGAPPALRAETLYAPAWSPDGKRISFEARLDGRFALMRMNADGTALRRLTESAGSDFASSWSPDGRRIVFTSTRDGNREIYVMDADGARPARLTRHEAEDGWPRWSPDGRWIAFVSARSGRRELYLMSPDGKDPRALTTGALDLDGRLAWHPGGRQILVRGAERGALKDESTPGFLYAIPLDGGAARRLGADARRDYNAVWAPDGERLAFDAHRDGGWESDDGGWEVFSARPDGSERRNLTRNRVNDWGPAWSPDGQRIAYCSGLENRYEIYVMKADGSAPTRLTFLVHPR
jgi:TolB protein